MGYAYPEGASAQLLVSNYDALTHQDADWLSTTALGRALAKLGCSVQALDILSKMAAQHPDEQFVLSSYAVALKLAGEETKMQEIVKHLLQLNPRNPEALALVQVEIAEEEPLGDIEN